MDPCRWPQDSYRVLALNSVLRYWARAVFSRLRFPEFVQDLLVLDLVAPSPHRSSPVASPEGLLHFIGD